MSTGGQTGTALTTTNTNLTSTIIRAKVRQITKRDNTTDLTNDEIDSMILEACREISKRKLCLDSYSSGTLSANSNTITIPSDMIPNKAGIEELYLDSVLLDPITFAEWRAGKVSGYAYYNGTIYIIPTSNTGRSYTLYYKKYHPNSVTSIQLNDDYKMAIVFFVCKKIYDDYEQPEKAIENEQKYEIELMKYSEPELAFTRMRNTRE